jgi:hypothetical protein
MLTDTEQQGTTEMLSTSIVHDLRNPLGGDLRSRRNVNGSRSWAEPSEAARNQYLSRSRPHAGIVGGPQQRRPWKQING